MDHSCNCGKTFCVFCQKIPISSAISVALKGLSQLLGQMERTQLAWDGLSRALFPGR